MAVSERKLSKTASGIELATFELEAQAIFNILTFNIILPSTPHSSKTLLGELDT
jgi:hypothetical protein